MEKLTTWWPDWTKNLSCHNSKNWPQRNENQSTPNWRLTVTKTIRMMLVRPLMTNLKMTVRDDCAVSAWRPPPTLSINGLNSLLVRVGELAFGQMSVLSPPPTQPQLLAPEIMETFLSTCRKTRINPSVGKIPWRRKWQSTPVFLPREFHGPRSLTGYSPWGCKESDMIEWLPFHFSFPGTLPAYWLLSRE